MKQGAPQAPARARDRWQQRSRAFAVRAALAEQEAELLRTRVALLERFVRHDVRTPLTVILGHAQMLAEGLVPPSRLAQSYEVMSRQSERLNTVLDQLRTPASEPGPGRVVWVTCAVDRVQEVTAELRGLPAIVVEPEVCELLIELGEPRVDAIGEALPGGLRRAVQAALAGGEE